MKPVKYEHTEQGTGFPYWLLKYAADATFRSRTKLCILLKQDRCHTLNFNTLWAYIIFIFIIVIAFADLMTSL